MKGLPLLVVVLLVQQNNIESAPTARKLDMLWIFVGTFIHIRKNSLKLFLIVK